MFLESLSLDLIGSGVVLDAIGNVDGADQVLFALDKEILQLKLVASSHKLQGKAVSILDRCQIQLIGVDPLQ